LSPIDLPLHSTTFQIWWNKFARRPPMRVSPGSNCPYVCYPAVRHIGDLGVCELSQSSRPWVHAPRIKETHPTAFFLSQLCLVERVLGASFFLRARQDRQGRARHMHPSPSVRLPRLEVAEEMESSTYRAARLYLAINFRIYVLQPS
jgi:hypothetical protein